MSAYGKRRFEFRAKKRAEERRKEEAARETTKSIGSFFQESLDNITVDNTMTSILSQWNLKRTRENKHKKSVVMRDRWFPR